MICKEIVHPGVEAGLARVGCSFRESLFLGLGPNQSLLLPESLPSLDADGLREILGLSPQERHKRLTALLFSDEFGTERAESIAQSALCFPVPVFEIAENRFVVELFHGPSFAFKDFGARFMARAMVLAREDGYGGDRVTILTATSGDTGAAVARAFEGLSGVEVVVLFPKGGVTEIQELQMTTTSGNVRAFEVEGSFDDCQSLVKRAFSDESLRREVGLTTANSMNLGRLLAQMVYYFDVVAALDRLGKGPHQGREITLSVPSGNFGNLAAGLLARRMGLPVSSWVAATNANDTIPRFLETGSMSPKPTVRTFSNAMDIARPNNWPRILECLADVEGVRAVLTSVSVSDDETLATIRRVERDLGYLLDPHGAVGYSALERCIASDRIGVVLATAHPAKFADIVEMAVSRKIEIPETLRGLKDLPAHKRSIRASFDALRDILARQV